MTTTIDNRTLRIMARNTLENAIVKAGKADVYGAEATYQQAQELVQQAVDTAASDHEDAASERLRQQVEDAFEDFRIEHQPQSSIFERMGTSGRAHIAALPDAERDIVMDIIDAEERINEINRELAQLQARASVAA